MTRDRTPSPCTGTTGASGKSHGKVFLLLVKTVKTSACPSKETDPVLTRGPGPLSPLLSTEGPPWARREGLRLQTLEFVDSGPEKAELPPETEERGSRWI